MDTRPISMRTKFNVSAGIHSSSRMPSPIKPIAVSSQPRARSRVASVPIGIFLTFVAALQSILPHVRVHSAARVPDTLAARFLTLTCSQALEGELLPEVAGSGSRNTSAGAPPRGAPARSYYTMEPPCLWRLATEAAHARLAGNLREA